MARPNRTGIDRTSRNGARRTGSRHARTRRGRSGGLRQTRDHIRARRHNRPGCRLTSQIRSRWRTQRTASTHGWSGNRLPGTTGLRSRALSSRTLGRAWSARRRGSYRPRRRSRWRGNGGHRRAERHSWRHDCGRRLRHVHHTSGKRLTRSREDLPRLRSGNRPGCKRRPSRRGVRCRTARLSNRKRRTQWMNRTGRCRKSFVFNRFFRRLRGGWRDLGLDGLLHSGGWLRRTIRRGRGFFHRPRGGRRFLVEVSLLGTESLTHAKADLERHVIVERAGMGLLVGDAQFRQNVENDAGLDLKLAGQLVDADFTHTVTPWRIPTHQGFKKVQLLLCQILTSALKPLYYLL